MDESIKKAFFEREIGEIYRLKVPFDGEVYTSVFLIKGAKNVLIDCATTDYDVENYIVPALQGIGLELAQIECVVLTHSHGDHSGGRNKIAQISPKMRFICSECELFNGLDIYPIAGHTLDSIGVFDSVTATLIAGDGLQGAGVGKYVCTLESREEYLKSLQKIKEDKRINNILFSHDYAPWNCDKAIGREQVEKILQDCKDSI